MSETYTNNVGRSDYRLPTVSANDNGKILKVVEGEWKKAEDSGGGGGGGGADNFVVHISFDETAGDFVISETYEEIKAALEAGKWVYGVSPDASTGEVLFFYVNSYNRYEIQLCSNPIMTTRSTGSPAESITVYYFFIMADGITGDTIVNFEQQVGTFAEQGSGELYTIPLEFDNNTNTYSLSGSAVRYIAENHPLHVAYSYQDPDEPGFYTESLDHFTSDSSSYSNVEVELDYFRLGEWEFYYDATTDTYSHTHNPIG